MLVPGTRLGFYEIVSTLGAGGMGEVYRATDTKLNREVALKVLPDAFTLDADRLTRFKREAIVLASLNHPHIGAIYGFEDSGDTHALVLELVEGDTLADRIAQGPIPVDEALPIAKQIAEALEAAHDQGIIHRDLKPANIKLRSDGTVKVLDFGLAKALEPKGASGVALSQSPTITSPAMTQMGVILGTAAYMSPEQARGKSVDRRSDIWAFGCVLYEMLTGQRAFGGEDVTDTLATVVRSEPAWDALPDDVSPSVRVFLRRCLQKNPKQRLHDIADMRLALDGRFETPAPHVSHGTVVRSSFWQSMVPVPVTAIVTLLAAGVGAWNLWPTMREQPVLRVSVPLPAEERLPALNTPVLALSQDGSRMAFISANEKGQQIYVRAFDSAEATAVPNTEGADGLAFSPDVNSLAFTSRGNLMRVSLRGGTPIVICSAPNVRGLSWGDNDMIAFAPVFGSLGLSIVSAGGGKPQRVTSTRSAGNPTAEGHRWPQVLPGGNAVLFTEWSRNIDDAQIVIQRLDSNERRIVLRGGTYARYVSTGHLLYVRAGTLMAVPFDLSRLEATGAQVPLPEGVLLTSEGAAQFEVSGGGSLVHVLGGLQGTGRQLTWVDRSGKEEPAGAPARAYLNPRISPDGRRIAVVVQGTNDDVWTYDTARETLTRLTLESRSISPVWTPDGKQVIYRSSRNGVLNLFARDADGGDEERLTTSDANETPTAISPDGAALVFTHNITTDLWVLPLVGEKKPRPFASTPFSERGGSFSPDSHWLAYSSDESGRDEIYIQPFPAGGRKVQISRDGGLDPRWVGSGELFWRNGTKMMGIKIGTEPMLTIGQPEAVFDGPKYARNFGTFDVSADGKRFLMIKEAEQAASVTQINLVLNWFEELKRLVPTN